MGNDEAYPPTSLPSFTSLAWGTNDSFAQSHDLGRLKDFCDGGPTEVEHSGKRPSHTSPSMTVIQGNLIELIHITSRLVRLQPLKEGMTRDWPLSHMLLAGNTALKQCLALHNSHGC